MTEKSPPPQIKRTNWIILMRCKYLLRSKILVVLGYVTLLLLDIFLQDGQNSETFHIKSILLSTVSIIKLLLLLLYSTTYIKLAVYRTCFH